MLCCGWALPLRILKETVADEVQTHEGASVDGTPPPESTQGLRCGLETVLLRRKGQIVFYKIWDLIYTYTQNIYIRALNMYKT